MKSKILKYLQLSREERKSFNELIWRLLLWRMLIAFLPFHRLAKYFGQSGKESPLEPNIDINYIELASNTLKRSKKALPWKPKCLNEAIAVKRLLKKYRIDSTLYLGVGKDSNQKLVGHAWLRCGNKIIAGLEESLNFSVVAKFS